MIYYDFKDYEGFKEIFGIIEHGNGEKSRKNKILLALYKDKYFLRIHQEHKYYEWCKEMYYRYDRKLDNLDNYDSSYSGCDKNRRKYKLIRFYFGDKEFRPIVRHGDLLSCRTLPILKTVLYNILGNTRFFNGFSVYSMILMGKVFYSSLYETDDMEGLCEDGTLNAIRYRNIEKDRVFKMKAGKMFNHLMSCNKILSKMPEQIQRWLSEEFVAEWIQYARENIGGTDYTLHVDDDFEGIYSQKRYLPEKNFGSCMVDDGQWVFYRESVEAKAAYLTDADGYIVARCILFTEVHEVGTEKIWRLAERQYSADGELSLQRQLVSALIRGGFIDGYKKVGASCHDMRAFVDNEGNSLEDKKFWISCDLPVDGTLSYQDSFKCYDVEDRVADNYGYRNQCLDTTERVFCLEDEDDHEGENWSEYHDCYISEDDSCYVESRGDYFYNYEVVDAYEWNRFDERFYSDYYFQEDCIEIDGDYYYAGENAESPEDYNIKSCPECGEWLVPNRGNAMYSELTEKWYCCSDCLDEAEETYHKDNGFVYSEYDGEWFCEPDDVITAKEWFSCYNKYLDTSISIESFNELVDGGRATEFCGKYYLDKVLNDGEPVHLLRDVA